MSEVIDIVGTTDATVAIVWADGTYTTEAGTFFGGRVEAEATVSVCVSKQVAAAHHRCRAAPVRRCTSESAIPNRKRK